MSHKAPCWLCSCFRTATPSMVTRTSRWEQAGIQRLPIMYYLPHEDLMYTWGGLSLIAAPLSRCNQVLWMPRAARCMMFLVEESMCGLLSLVWVHLCMHYWPLQWQTHAWLNKRTLPVWINTSLCINLSSSLVCSPVFIFSLAVPHSAYCI